LREDHRLRIGGTHDTGRRGPRDLLPHLGEAGAKTLGLTCEAGLTFGLTVSLAKGNRLSRCCLARSTATAQSPTSFDSHSSQLSLNGPC